MPVWCVHAVICHEETHTRYVHSTKSAVIVDSKQMPHKPCTALLCLMTSVCGLLVQEPAGNCLVQLALVNHAAHSLPLTTKQLWRIMKCPILFVNPMLIAILHCMEDVGHPVRCHLDAMPAIKWTPTHDSCCTNVSLTVVLGDVGLLVVRLLVVDGLGAGLGAGLGGRLHVHLVMQGE